MSDEDRQALMKTAQGNRALAQEHRKANRWAMVTVVLVGAAGFLGGFAVGARGAEAQDPPVVDAVHHAKVSKQLLKERTAAHTTIGKLRRELRRKRATVFNEADTRTAAALVGVIIGWPVAGALRVAECESHLKPWARNSTSLSGSNASGSWQTLYSADGRRSSTWHSTDVGRALPGDVFNPYVNAFVAARVWQRNHNTFREWNDVCARQG